MASLDLLDLDHFDLTDLTQTTIDAPSINGDLLTAQMWLLVSHE